MKKLNKYIKVGIIVCLAAALLVTSLWGNGSVEAAPSRMSGVQKVINTISETDPYTIVEIVPDKSDATLGFLVKGFEPEVPGALLKTVKGEAARKEKALEWLNKNAGGSSEDKETMISYVGSDVYEEQIYCPEDPTGWTILYYQDGYTEERTGAFKEAVDYGLEKGNYNAEGEYVGEGNGDYVWVDGAGETKTIPVRRIYCKMNFTSNNWFAEKVLESEDANVEVKVMTPRGFEDMLSIGGISWTDVDMLYLNASDATSYASEGETSVDFSAWSTAVQIYNQVVGAKLPVILDTRIMTDAKNEDTDICNLAYLLTAYNEEVIVGDPLDITVLQQAKTDAEAKITSDEYSEGVCQNVYFGTKFVDISLTNKLGKFYGKEEVLAEFENENFYHEVNNTEYTTERTPNGEYKISRASLMKYVVHTGNKRVETSKEKIRVLDIEPTKYSLLKESDVRGWLGEYAADPQLFEIELVQTTTAEFNGLMTDLVESYDLIYIGSYDGPAIEGDSLVGGLNVVNSSTVYNDAALNGLIYSDVGDIAVVPSEFADISNSQHDEAGNLITRYSGNDITDMKCQELKEFVECGYPVIISNALYKGGGRTIDAGKVKDTSNMYAFMNEYTGSNSVGNVMKQGETTSALLDRYINLSKLTLTMTQVPLEYGIKYADDAKLMIDEVQGLETGEALQYSFEFTDDARVISEGMYYKLQLFVDNDADGQYSDYEEWHELDVRDIQGNKVEVNQIVPGQRYWVTRTIEDSYKGVLSWKLKVSLFDAEDKELSARDSATGQTFVKYDTNADTIEVKALQLTLDTGLDLTSGTVGELLKDLSTKGVYNISIEPVTVSMYLKMDSSLREEFLNDYDMLIVGFADNYAETVIADVSEEMVNEGISELEKYVESGKAVLFSHDTTSYKDIQPEVNYWGYKLNRLVRKYAGKDPYDALTEDAGTGDDTTGDSSTDATVVSGGEGFTNMILDANLVIDPDSEEVVYKSLAYSGSNATEPASRISQVNVGQITSFPYDVNIDPEDSSTYLSDIVGEGLLNFRRIPNVHIMTPMSMEIKPTTAQSYQLDLDCDRDGDGKSDLIVWYSLAGALGGETGWAALDALLRSNAYAAMPNDVRNNYYIYSLGNVTYTAMGYSTELSDYEAKLFVNTLIAAYNLGLKDPKVNILNDKEDKGSVIYDVYRPFDEEAQIFCETDQDIYFHVKDSNVISGTKKVTINAYYEVNSTELYHKTIMKDDKVIYLRQFSDIEEMVHDQALIDQFKEGTATLPGTGDGTTPDSTVPDMTLLGDASLNELLNGGHYLVDDRIYELSVSKDSMNSVLRGKDSMKVYIGVQVDLNHESGRVDKLDEIFAVLEIKKMSLFNLD